MGEASGIGARFGVERCLDPLHLAVEPRNHFLYDGIRPYPDTAAYELHGQMAIAEMPSNSGHRSLVMRMNFNQRLRPGTDANDAAIIQAQPVSVLQQNSLWQIEKHIFASLCAQDDAAAIP
jgi:hypothetical protein